MAVRATPRRANFSGGWAVAYDKPGLRGKDAGGYPCESCGRSAFGIAGAGVLKGDGEGRYRWENSQEYADGSFASWGLEGGSGPGWLAYVEIEGQECLYNVWSNVSQQHLQLLIHNIRFIDE